MTGTHRESRTGVLGPGTQGVGTMVLVALRTGWKALAVWVLALVGVMVLTGSSIGALYDTPEKIRGYAESLGGDAMAVLNGRVAGLDTLGGVFANEFGFVLSFGLPLMAIALTSRATRRDEEAGRLELLLAARIGRRAPLLAAVLVASGAVLLTGLGCGAAMAAFGADARGSLLYGLGIAALGFVFVGITAVAAQVVEHGRAVWGIGLALTVLLYLVRGIGALERNGLVWLSPHGWVDQVRAFGDARAWPLLLALGVGVALVALAFWLLDRRDVGSALVRPRRSAPRASAALRTPLGLAVRQHRGAVIGWAVVGAALMAVYGSLAQAVIDVITENRALGGFLGADVEAAAEVVLRTVMSTFVMMLAMLVAAFVVAGVGTLRKEEESGRLEVGLSSQRSRGSWLGVHLLVVLAGALVVGLVGALALGSTTAASLGEDAWVGDVLAGAAAQAPAVLIFAGVAVALFGWRPRAHALGWAALAMAALLAYLGPGFDLPDVLLDASPFLAVGQDVVGDGASSTGVLVLLVLSALLVAAGFLGFRRRDVPVA
ncbi:ABC transporter permease [Ornithinimicrobium sp. W1665]|uniref:ABC transporter permease n=1 Tax=Ornithinimicrobium sp. W1665 TaxID=3416666 RepID=UPI003CE754CD